MDLSNRFEGNYLETVYLCSAWKDELLHDLYQVGGYTTSGNVGNKSSDGFNWFIGWVKYQPLVISMDGFEGKTYRTSLSNDVKCPFNYFSDSKILVSSLNFGEVTNPCDQFGASQCPQIVLQCEWYNWVTISSRSPTWDQNSWTVPYFSYILSIHHTFNLLLLGRLPKNTHPRVHHPFMRFPEDPEYSPLVSSFSLENSPK